MLPALPGDRVEYQTDGTIVRYNSVSNPTWKTYTEAQAKAQNGPGQSVSLGHDQFDQSIQTVSFFFPQPRDLKGVYWGGFWGWDQETVISPFTVWTSTDTTDGTDGTWTQQTTWSYTDTWPSDGPINKYRTAIRAVSVAGVRGVRLRGQGRSSGGGRPGPHWAQAHVYADIPATAGDRLQMWHPTLDQPLRIADMDMGDVPAGGTPVVKTFRVKNMSTSYTAIGITVARDVATDGTSPGGVDTYTDFFKVSPDGTTWSNSFSISDLPSGTISPVLYCRLAAPVNAFGTFDPFVKATPTDWT